MDSDVSDAEDQRRAQQKRIAPIHRQAETRRDRQNGAGYRDHAQIPIKVLQGVVTSKIADPVQLVQAHASKHDDQPQPGTRRVAFKKRANTHRDLSDSFQRDKNVIFLLFQFVISFWTNFCPQQLLDELLSTANWARSASSKRQGRPTKKSIALHSLPSQTH